MLNEGRATKMVEAILDYMYEEGEDKISNAEALGILEFCKFSLIQNALEEELA